VMRNDAAQKNHCERAFLASFSLSMVAGGDWGILKAGSAVRTQPTGRSAGREVTDSGRRTGRGWIFEWRTELLTDTPTPSGAKIDGIRTITQTKRCIVTNSRIFRAGP